MQHKKFSSPPGAVISPRTSFCNVRKQPCWWSPWRRPIPHLHSPARPERWPLCTANCGERHTFNYGCSVLLNVITQREKHLTLTEQCWGLFWGLKFVFPLSSRCLSPLLPSAPPGLALPKQIWALCWALRADSWKGRQNIWWDYNLMSGSWKIINMPEILLSKFRSLYCFV